MSWLIENFTVLSYSIKTQITMVMGCLLFIAILIVGDHMADSVKLSGPLTQMSSVIKYYISTRYELLALGILFSFMVVALKLFRSDKDRFLYGQ